MTFFSFFLEYDRIFFQEKLVRQVIELEWPKGGLYRKQYTFGLPAEICGSRRRIQGSPGLLAPPNFEPWADKKGTKLAAAWRCTGFYTNWAPDKRPKIVEVSKIPRNPVFDHWSLSKDLYVPLAWSLVVRPCFSNKPSPKRWLECNRPLISARNRWKYHGRVIGRSCRPILDHGRPCRDNSGAAPVPRK